MGVNRANIGDANADGLSDQIHKLCPSHRRDLVDDDGKRQRDASA